MLKITASREPGASHCFRIEAEHWTVDPVTPKHASLARRLEIDAWLAEQEIVTIQVEGRHLNGIMATEDPFYWQLLFGTPVPARLVQKALGEGI